MQKYFVTNMGCYSPPQILEAHDVDVRLEYSNTRGAYRTVRLDYFIRGARLNGVPRVSNSHFSYSIFPSTEHFVHSRKHEI